MVKSENFLLTFNRTSQKSPPSVGGDEGEGGPKGLYSVHPHPHLPHRKGEGIVGNFKYIWLGFIWVWCLEFGA